MRTPTRLMASLWSKYLAVTLLFFALCLPVYSAIETHSFTSEVQRERYQSFIEEMRCPKCQNQNLAGSDSPISTDLRREIYEMIKADKSDQEIVNFMVNRYGEFILYRPRISPVTYILWGAPVALLMVGVIVLLVMLRQRRRLALARESTSLSADEQARLNALLASYKEEHKAEHKAEHKNTKPKNNKSTNNQEPH